MGYTAKIEVTLDKLKMPIAGIRGIDVLVDDATILSLDLGETATANVAPGEHVVQFVLNGIFRRTSKKMKISFDDNSTVKIHGKYSRIWGNLTIQRT